jgi:3-hydroxymyristoyl/3-hydroxydecanoyl-(acyl carrier protein) dehydratase
MTEHTNVKWSEAPHLPEIRAERQDGNLIELDIFADARLFQFQGHFPNEPVLPGVAQIDWAMRFGQEYLSLAGEISRLGQLKFSKLIVGNSDIVLRLEWREEKQRLMFSYSQGEETCSSGFFELTAQ